MLMRLTPVVTLSVCVCYCILSCSADLAGHCDAGWQWCAWVIFVMSESTPSHKPFQSKSSRSYKNFCEASHDLV